MTNTNLPGVTFQLSDGNLTITPPPPTGDTIILIGQAPDGPVNIPVQLAGVRDLTGLFGPMVYTTDYPSPDGDPTKLGTFSGNTLIKTARELVMGGAGNILLVRTGGNYATSNTSLLGGVTVQSFFPGAVYNGATVTAYSVASGTVVSCTQPSSKGPSFSLPFSAQTTYDTVCAQFNRDPRNTSFKLICSETAASGTAANNPHVSATATLSGGTNGTLRDDFAGTTKSALYASITDPDTGTFTYLDGVQGKILYVAGLYADDDIANDPTKSFLTDFAIFCYNQSNTSYPMTGVIGLRPLLNPDRPSINNRISALTGLGTGYADALSKQLNMGQFLENGIPYSDPNDATAGTVDIGRHVSIVAGPDLIYTDNNLGTYVDTAAPFYAGLVSSLAPQNGATNTIINTNVSPAYLFTLNQLGVLNAGVGFTGAYNAQGGGAYVTLKQRNRIVGTTLVVTEDVTAAARTSDFADLQTFRIVQAAEGVVEGAAANFLGKPNNTATITALDSQLRSGLDVLAENGALNGGYQQGYNYQILSTPGAQALGEIRIILQLKPAFEIRFIRTQVSVSL